MIEAPDTPAGYLAVTLNAHLPYVVNHGSWPHGMEWLLEAAADSYLPLLRVLANLERDGVPANFNISLSPILLEQLVHPLFRAEFPRYLARKIVTAREDEAYFMQSGDASLAATARFWGHFFSTALDDFNALDGNIVQGFRHFSDAGLVEIITCTASHGYLPLLGTDESVRAQVRTAVQTHIQHFGKHPRGIWLPECGYRPAGLWNYPVPVHCDEAGPDEGRTGFGRIGIEQALSESSLDYFFADTHLVEETGHSLYRPCLVDGPYDKHFATTVFPRDPRTGLQVWSSDTGYPFDPNYLDFHKRRFPGGHRYWRVTGPHVDIDDKLVYQPQEAAQRIQLHAEHFVSLVRQTLQPSFNERTPPVLCAPFDADLFGHWWFEGALWLEAVARALHAGDSRIATTACSRYLDRYPPSDFIALREGSWGSGGNHQVWLNPQTSWTYTHIYPAGLYTREICTAGRWRDSDLATRIVRQICRELLLLESSDWQSLISTGAALDYAERRLLTHNDRFLELKAIWQAFQAAGSLSPPLANRLAEIERIDCIFPRIDPGLWAAGAIEARALPSAP